MEINLIQETELQRMRFARLPRNLQEAMEAREEEEKGFLALEHAELTNEEYDEFTSNFRAVAGWLEGTGGWSNETTSAERESEEWWDGAYHLCIKVTSPDRRTLYVDAQGQDRPVYVGVEENPAN